MAAPTQNNLETTVAGVDLQLWRQLFLQASTPLLVLKGPEHRFELVNDAYVRLMLRHSTADLIGKPIGEAIPELSGQGVFEMLDEVYSTGTAHLGKEEHRTLIDSATGIAHDAFFDVLYKPILGEDGRPIGIMIQGNDVTEHVLARQRSQAREEALTLEWEKLENMYRTAPVGFAMYEPVEFRMIQVNDKFTEMLNLSAEEMMGKSVLDIARNISGVRERFAYVAKGGRLDNIIVEGELEGNPGVCHTWLVNYTPLMDGEGKVRAISTVALDIPAQKRAEAALIKSEKLAAVGRLASSIAHEINNPLESVTNLLYLAQRGGRDADRAHYLALADQELRRVSAIANQTLRFHKQQTRPALLSAEPLIQSTLSIYEGRLRNSEIHVEQQLSGSDAVLCMDSEIRQVLSSLVDNAIDSMPTGGRLLLRSRTGTDWRTDRHGLILTVADTGSGMEKSTYSKAFEAFFTTKGIGGTGLGLWVSSEIVHRHNGRITVRSSTKAAHRGTVISLFLPFHEEQRAETFEIAPPLSYANE